MDNVYSFNPFYLNCYIVNVPFLCAKEPSFLYTMCVCVHHTYRPHWCVYKQTELSVYIFREPFNVPIYLRMECVEKRTKIGNLIGIFV